MDSFILGCWRGFHLIGSISFKFGSSLWCLATLEVIFIEVLLTHRAWLVLEFHRLMRRLYPPLTVYTRLVWHFLPWPAIFQLCLTVGSPPINWRLRRSHFFCHALILASSLYPFSNFSYKLVSCFKCFLLHRIQRVLLRYVETSGCSFMRCRRLSWVLFKFAQFVGLQSSIDSHIYWLFYFSFQHDPKFPHLPLYFSN